ncbi:MAG: nucleoside-diphosphate kinase [Bdellovibrionota bacterium]
MQNTDTQSTLVLIKPDAMRNSLTGYVLSQLSEFHTGLYFAGAKVVSVSKMLAEEHYAEHKGKVFFPSLLEYICGKLHYSEAEADRRRVIALIYQGSDAVAKIRAICGPTNPHVARDTKPGCIRALGTVVPLKDEAGNSIGDRMDNLIHASANTADAEREIKLWFKPNDVQPAMRQYATKTAEDLYYYNNGKLTQKWEKGSTCLVAAGDTVWASDLAALEAIIAGKTPTTPLESIAAKYMINE